MQKFTCLTCRVSLGSAENQRDHYKSEWHIYNLKRKLNQLAPLSEEEYKEVLQKHTSESLPEDGRAEASFHCETCKKTMANSKAFNQHNTSKKHIQMLVNGKKGKEHIDLPVKIEPVIPKCNDKESANDVAKEEMEAVEAQVKIIDGDAENFDEDEWEEVDEDEEVLVGIPLNECLFCSEVSEDMTANLIHMSNVHTFFIPDTEFCTDLKGLLNYLGIKIASGFCCLWCSEYGKQFASKKSAQQHMLDKGHMRIKMEHGSEALLEFEDFFDYSTGYPDGEPNDELNPDEFQLDGGDYQLKLPSGNVIGHRSLFVYYKQNLKAQPAEKKSKNKELLNKVLGQYRALGWTGMTTRDAVQRAKDIGNMHRSQQKSKMRLCMKHNLNLQPHLRNPLGFN